MGEKKEKEKKSQQSRMTDNLFNNNRITVWYISLKYNLEKPISNNRLISFSILKK